MKPEICSFDPAPFNFGTFQLACGFEKFRFDWERGYLGQCKRVTFAPTFEDDINNARTFLELDVKPEFEICELGHLNYVTWLLEEGLVKTPVHLQFVFGPMVGWMQPSVKYLVMMHEEAVSILGQGNFTWSVAGAGRHQIPLAATAMAPPTWG